MGYLLSKMIGVALSPGVIFAVILAFGVAQLWTRRWKRGRTLLTYLAVVVGGLLLLPIDSVMIRSLEDRFSANPQLPDRIDGIIILGGVVDQYLSAVRHQISMNDAAERLFQGAVLANAHPEARIVMTSGTADPIRPEMKEAPWAAEALLEMGIKPSQLIIEDQSRNTYENAVFSERLANPKKGETWVLITSARQMPRAVGVFRHIGWQVIPWPVDYLTGGGLEWTNTDLVLVRFHRLNVALHEWIGLLFYRLSGWTDSLLPSPG